MRRLRAAIVSSGGWPALNRTRANYKSGEHEELCAEDPLSTPICVGSFAKYPRRVRVGMFTWDLDLSVFLAITWTCGRASETSRTRAVNAARTGCKFCDLCSIIDAVVDSVLVPQHGWIQLHIKMHSRPPILYR